MSKVLTKKSTPNGSERKGWCIQKFPTDSRAQFVCAVKINQSTVPSALLAFCTAYFKVTCMNEKTVTMPITIRGQKAKMTLTIED